MNYFEQLKAGAEELDAKGSEYLKRLGFIPNDEVIDRIYRAIPNSLAEAEKIDSPWWVLQILDGHFPFDGPPQSGALQVILGYSPTAQDARLRNLLEIAEGRESKELDLLTIADP